MGPRREENAMKVLITAAAAAALAGVTLAQANAADTVKPIAIPKVVAPAPSPVSGYVDIYGGWGWNHALDDGDTENDNFGVFGGNGAANLWLSPNTSVQLDVNAEGS